MALAICLMALACTASVARAEALARKLAVLVGEHDRILAAESAVESAMYGVRQAEAGWFPTVDLTMEFTREEIEPAPPDTAASVDARNEEILRAEQLLYDFGGTSGAVAAAEARHAQALTRLDQASQQLLFDGARAYLDVMRAYERLRTARVSEERIMEQTGVEEALVERGAGLSSNVLQAKQQLAGAMALRVLAEGELSNALTRYHAVFDQWVEESELSSFQRPPDPFSRLPMTVEDAVRLALARNPELLIAAQNEVLAQEQLNQAESLAYPTLSLFAEGKRRENDSGLSGVRTESSVGLAVEWNLYNGGADQAAARAARAEVQRARYNQRDLARSVEQEVRVAWENLLTFRYNAELLRNQADILAEFLELARRERKMGTRSLLDLLSAEVMYLNASGNAVSADYDTLLAAYNVLAVTGGLDLAAFEETAAQ